MLLSVAMRTPRTRDESHATLDIFNTGDCVSATALARSVDFESWEWLGVVFAPSPPGWDAYRRLHHEMALWDRFRAECPGFARNCETKGLKYSNVMPSQSDPSSGMGRSWQSTLRASTPQEAEERLQRLGYAWTWLADGCLRATTPVLPAVRKLPDGRTSFFNQLIAAFQGWKDERNEPSNAITFGDGTPLDPDAVSVAARLGEELSFDVRWRRADVVLVDNYVTMHGRRGFTGTRKVLASLIGGE